MGSGPRDAGALGFDFGIFTGILHPALPIDDTKNVLLVFGDLMSWRGREVSAVGSGSVTVRHSKRVVGVDGDKGFHYGRLIQITIGMTRIYPTAIDTAKGIVTCAKSLVRFASKILWHNPTTNDTTAVWITSAGVIREIYANALQSPPDPNRYPMNMQKRKPNIETPTCKATA